MGSIKGFVAAAAAAAAAATAAMLLARKALLELRKGPSVKGFPGKFDGGGQGPIGCSW